MPLINSFLPWASDYLQGLSNISNNWLERLSHEWSTGLCLGQATLSSKQVVSLTKNSMGPHHPQSWRLDILLHESCWMRIGGWNLVTFTFPGGQVARNGEEKALDCTSFWLCGSLSSPPKQCRKALCSFLYLWPFPKHSQSQIYLTVRRLLK